jgi:acetyl-CoA carboxylase carboxyltransferase component
VHPPGFPIDVALEPFLARAAGDRERAVVDALIATESTRVYIARALRFVHTRRSRR